MDMETRHNGPVQAMDEDAIQSLLERLALSPKSAALQAAEAKKDELIILMLTRLSLIYWRPDYSPGQAEQVYEQYLEDLREFALAAISAAVVAWRRNGENRFFPQPGQLRALIEAHSKFESIHERRAQLRREAQDEMQRAMLEGPNVLRLEDNRE